MTSYNYATLDPRNADPSKVKAGDERAMAQALQTAAANDAIFAQPVFGIEVTVPALAARCVANLDPQHSGNAELAAIEAALSAELPTTGMTLATIKADLDALGAMVVFELRAQGVMPAMQIAADSSVSRVDGGGLLEWSDFIDRLHLIANADKFAKGGYAGPKALPTRDNLWPEDATSVESTRPLAAIAAAVADFKVSLADRVSILEQWLLTGEEPAQYRAQVENERLALVDALEDGTIVYETRNGGRIAVVISTHRAATMVGYALAPVVVAFNPTFKQGPGDPYRKFTVCAFEAKYADIRAALAELAQLEPGWAGSPTIGGSPQGTSTNLTIDQVVEVVAKHLK